MGARVNSAVAGPLVTVLPSNGADTLVCTTSIFVTPTDTAAIFLAYFLNVLVGTGTGVLTLYLRRGPTLLSPFLTVSGIAASVIGGGTYMISGSYVDVAFSGTSQLSLSVQGSGTTGVSTVYDAALLAYIL